MTIFIRVGIVSGKEAIACACFLSTSTSTSRSFPRQAVSDHSPGSLTRRGLTSWARSAPRISRHQSKKRPICVEFL